MHASASPIEARQQNKAPTPSEADGPARGPSTKSISASLFKAHRTWSFGGQKKQSIPPPRDEPAVPDLPPVLTIQTGSASVPTQRARSHAPTPGPPEEKKALDLGGDFGAMFSNRGLDTVRETASNPRSLTGGRHNTMPASISEPILRSDSMPTATYPTEYKKSTPSPVLDEDAKLLRDSFAAMKFLDGPNPGNGLSATESFYSRQPRDDPIVRKPVTIAESFTKDKEDNLFEGRTYSFAKNNNRYISQRTAHPPRNKVMTPAQFERYKQDKERQGLTAKTSGPAPSIGRTAPTPPPKQEDDDEDEINYDDDEDEAEKSKQQVRQRRKQEAHMAVYRQQMMKVTGEHAAPAIAPARPNLPATMSAPQLSTIKTSPNLTSGVSDEDEDDEVPLAILQAHGFPAKNRAPTRLSVSGSNPNLRNSYQASISRPQSVVGDAPSTSANRRASTLPAFARGLPQDPFVGASIHKPAVRESLSFHEGPRSGHSSLHPGGLVGVIANEERSRAMRRGSPNMEARPLPPNMYQQTGPGGYDPIAGIPHHMMYSQGGMNGMNGMGGGMGGGNMMPGMSSGDQAQQQITQQMQQFMQMQMQFMQMMAMNQNQANPQGTPHMPQMPQMPQMPNSPYAMQQQQGGFAAAQSMGNLSSRQSVMGMEPMMDRFDPNMRTMSMVQPPQIMGHHPGYAGSTHGSLSGGMGYTPSIAPSERSNIGLPGRYRPVSHVATPSPGLSLHSDSSNTMTGGLGAGLAISDAQKSRSSLNVSRKVSDGSDDDDESGWAAMKAKREKKRSLWHRKKPLSGDLTNEQLAGI